MQIIVLLPFIICTFALFRRSLPQVFIGIYLPLFVFFPSYYYWKVATLPPINVAQSGLLPIGAAIALTLLPRWRFTTADIWIAIFMISTCVADYQNGETTASIFDLFNNLVEGLVPYMIGKTLIEQSGLRAATAKRIVTLMVLCGIVSAYEYRMAYNPFTLIWSRFFPDEKFAWKTQIRWGFGRVSGPYGQSELAGIVILFAIMLAVWVAYAYPWEEKFAWFPNLPVKKKTVILFALFVFLFMTQARGPWLGCLFALPIAYIGNSKRVLRNTLLFALIAIPLLAAGYIATKKFVANPNPSSNEAQTAQYRQQLIENYVPVAKAGGAWGWGQRFPRAPGQESIDNEYLFVWLVQGWIGLGAFVLLILESLTRLILAAIASKTQMDRFFAYSLFGAYAGILLTIATVFLGNQPYQLFFLIAGWAQVISRVNPMEKSFEFEQVLS